MEDGSQLSSAQFVAGRKFFLLFFVYFCLGALHYLISLHCAARSGTASVSASTSLFFSNCFIAAVKVGFI